MSSAAVLLRDYKWDVDALVSDYTDDPDGTLASHNVTRPTAAAELGACAGPRVMSHTVLCA